MAYLAEVSLTLPDENELCWSDDAGVSETGMSRASLKQAQRSSELGSASLMKERASSKSLKVKI